MAKERTSLKSLARLGLDSPIGSPIRAAIISKEARAEKAVVEQAAEKCRVELFQPASFVTKLGSKPQADTFFILGSGASINDLSPQNFQEVGRQRSVGVNNWPIHSFVPDVYSFDSVPWVGDGQNFRRSLDLLHRQDIVGADPQVLIVRLKNESEIAHINSLPQELRSNVHFYGRVMPATRKVSNLASDLGKAIRMLHSEFPGVVIDSGASIVRMVGIGLALGYSKIVLLGVDLNNTNYFWENNPLFLAGEVINSPANNQRESTHETTNTLIRPFSVVHLMRALGELVADQFGGRLYIGSKKSELSSFLDVYQWE